MAAELSNSSTIAPPSSQSMSATASPPSESDVDSNSNRFPRSSNLSGISPSPSAISLRSEEYRQLFRLPSEEVLVQDFNCALQENILLQGHMYLFDHYICFYSNIFGFESKKIIPIQDVTAVRRAKTAGIFPNAIEIVAAGKKHFFASFLSRDEAFKLIADAWSQNGTGPKQLLDHQESKSEISFQFDGVSSVENGNGSDSPVNESDTGERNTEVSSPGDTNSPPNHVDDVRPTPQEVPDIVEEKRDTVSAAGPSTSRSAKWKPEARDAPEIPKSYAKAGESKFPINVEQFYSYFFSDDAVRFVESYHNTCGDKDFKCTSWKPCEKFGYIREKSFQHPIKIYFGAKCGGCKETQKYRVYKDSHLMIETSQEVSDVPYADYFTVEGIWDVQKDDNESEGCILRVYVGVVFSKKTIWKGKIEQSTLDECRETYATWINLAHQLLKEKNIDKTEDNMVEGEQIDQKSTGESGDRAERPYVIAESGIVTETNTMGNHERTGKLHAVTTTSTMKGFANKCCSFFKSRGSLQPFLVIVFSIILFLMQLSIVVLLRRPQQVYLVPQADHYTSAGLGSGQRAAEATVAWMEKRVHLLKDEMFVVEGQLERMRHEHIMLKAQLKDLERRSSPCIYIFSNWLPMIDALHKYLEQLERNPGVILELLQQL